MIDPNQDQIALADASVAGAQAAAGAPETMLVMRLAGEAFAVPVAEVDEIVDPIDETTVPGAPRHAPSLVNVRGAIAPVIDIRSRLGMGPRGERASGARMIVLEVQQGGLLMRLAIEAEAVEEVAEIDLAALMPLPEQGASWPPELVRGVARLDGGLIIVLDTHALFAPSEIVGERGTQTDMARAV